MGAGRKLMTPRLLGGVAIVVSSAALISSCGGEGGIADLGRAFATSLPAPYDKVANDFNNDNNSDILFQNTAGQLYLWTLDGAGAIAGGGYLYAGALAPWKVVGSADLNNDGSTDILFQNPAGQLYVWYMNGAGMISSSGYFYAGGLAPWKVVAVSDLNGDGNADLLFQNDAGQLYVWYMNGAGAISNGAYFYDGALGDWKVVGTADFNSDNKTDVLFQNTAGQLYVWHTNGAGSIVSGGYLSGELGEWRVVSTADLNNDSKADILFQNNAGLLYVWYMNGAGSISSGKYFYDGGLGDWRAFGKASGATAANIDMQSFTDIFNEFGNFLPICTTSATPLQVSRRSGLAAQLLSRGALRQSQLSGSPITRPLALTSTPPADVLGSCGGRYGYRNYSHVNGVTTATLSFESYCTDTDNGDQQTITGGINFVDTATPTADGPVTTQLEASTSSPVSFVSKNAAGTTLGTGSASFSGFKTVIGVPGGNPTQANPNVVTLSELSGINATTGNNYRLTGLAVTQFVNSANGLQVEFNGRGYRSDGQYFDLSTPQPLVFNSNLEPESGQVMASGANNTNAVATLVPGTTLQATVTINGTPVTSVPACVP